MQAVGAEQQAVTVEKRCTAVMHGEAVFIIVGNQAMRQSAFHLRVLNFWIGLPGFDKVIEEGVVVAQLRPFPACLDQVGAAMPVLWIT